MGKRKGAFTAVAMLATAAVVAACGSDDSGEQAAGGSAAGGESYTMTLISALKSDPFYLAMKCAAEAEAKAQGVTIDYQGSAEFNAAQQTPIVNAVTAKKPDAVLIAPADSKALFTPIKQMAADGIKVVLVDTTLDDPSMAISVIGSDNEKGGEAAGEAMGELLGGKGKVMVVTNSPGISTTAARARGFETAAKAAGLEFVGVQYDDGEPAKAAPIINAELQRHPDLAGVFATNPYSAEGAETALQQAGKRGTIKLVTSDAEPNQVEDLEAGRVQALVAQRPAEMGKHAVTQALAALRGETVTETIGTDFTVVTQDNLAEQQDALYKPEC